MDLPIPAPNASAPQNGSLRIALLGMAMAAFMFLWSNMQGDLPMPEVTLASARRIDPAAARHACYTVWRRTCIRYQPLCSELVQGLRHLRDDFAALRIRKATPRRYHSLSLKLLRSLGRIEPRPVLERITHTLDLAQQQLNSIALDSMQNILQESADQLQILRWNLPRISHGGQSDRTTR